MSPRPSICCNEWLVRGGGVLLLLAAVGGGLLLLNSVSQADTPTVSLQPHAQMKAKDSLEVAVVVNHNQKDDLTGQLCVELLDADGKVVHTSKKQIRQKAEQGVHVFKIAQKNRPMEKLTIRTRFGERSREESLSSILLAKGHETSLSAGKEYCSGSRSALYCRVYGVRSLSETVPLPTSDVVIRLRDRKDKTHTLYKGKTQNAGEAIAQFNMPELMPGGYTLEVTTKSAFGEETLKQSIRIRDDAKILLVSDKPIYQPGQMMHIRALALRPFDLRPVANRKLLFEVEDSKGNKVFKRTYETSAFGVASVDFQLADEVNMGNYQIRAFLTGAEQGQQHQAQKTVTVKRYVLPKFKVAIKTAKKFYLPKEKIEGSIQADYFFGKPIAQGKVQITASTFDVAFRKFATWNGKTDDNGHVKFDIQLPDYFVGQPLQKGDAMVKLDVKIIDSADQVVKKAKSYPVSDKAIKIALISEGGKLVPDMENRVFAAATYPDGSPAECQVKLWLGKNAKGKEFASLQTSKAGLAEFNFTPKAKDFRQGGNAQRNIELLGGNQVGWAPQMLLDLTAKAKDGQGQSAQTQTTLNAHPLGENVLLRLDKAIYQPGDRVNVDVRTSAGLPTVFLDIVRGGQVMLSRWLNVKDGKAQHELDLPPEVFGTMELHAYQMLNTGEIIRDSRVVYVQPQSDLKIKVDPSKSVFEPGENGRIRFLVTDRKGTPTAAALGVVIVDEAVYALQDLHPGLEKVYFTLQKELLKPQVQAKFKPADNLPVLIRQPNLPAARQQVAQCLLTAVKVKAPPRWNVEQMHTRKKQAEARVNQLGWALWNTAWNQNSKINLLKYNKAKKKIEFADNALQQLLKRKMVTAAQLQGPFGKQLNLNDLAKLRKEFTAENLAKAVTMQRIQNLSWWVVHESNRQRAKYFKNGKWILDAKLLQDAVKRHAGNSPLWKQDIWGGEFRLMKRTKKDRHPTGQAQLQHYKVVSAGADRKFGTKDDLTWTAGPQHWAWGGNWMFGARDFDDQIRLGDRFHFRARRELLQRMDMPNNRNGAFPARGGFGGGFPGGAPVPQAAAPPGLPVNDAAGIPKQAQQSGASGKAPPRIRDYFPETMLWQPQLITNDQGVADLSVNFADSITSWRLTASANSQAGSLGGVTVPLKVFQDFFVDIDLPVNWTQHDEVSFPVAVFNYLNQPQTVKIELKKGSWFSLLEGDLTRELKLKANEVTSVRFRIKADRIGNHPLTVMAYGSKKSDAVRRVIEVTPNGERQEIVVNGRLQGNVAKTIDIPQTAIPDSYKLLVRVYPGVMAQVMEGMEGMLRLPGG